MLKIIRWRFYNSVWKYFIFHISIWRIFFWYRKHITHIRIFLVQPLNNIVCFKNRHTHGLTWQQTSTKLKVGYVSQKIMVCKEVYGSSSVCKKYVKKEKDTLSTIDLSPKWTSISQFFTVDLCGLNFLVFIIWSRSEHGLHTFLQWNAGHK